ncbi:glutamyl-tRNA reductase [Caldinitratiruptor microaerophilus]|uniref:Glutamyl-tRNA reductase n=1 Tax=Caldinitratiruptor microaerophilus TaxID=671077 RepID=A0AA35CHX5_9FIRM|nr:glutamyl-tRNA reductase [Caldinitratiruptor microaerophilus]BDG59222.1 glutamyl-tRNA reductase [Caldinitratiruptor microaerophilus]
MHLLALGLSHRTAPVELRETLAFGPEELPGVLARLRDEARVEEVALLSTCNRTELYVAHPVWPDPEVLIRSLAAQKRVDPENIRPYLYRREDLEAAAHLFRVAAGLDSMVLGETQVLGQVRDAYQAAAAAGTAGKVLSRLMTGALAAAKRAQTETGIGQNAVSVPYAAVELARKLFETLQGRVVMAIGAGETAKLTVRHLAAAGVGRIYVANRTLDRARELAAEVGGVPIPLEAIRQHLPEVDVVISSTGSPHPILRREDIQQALRARRGRPIFLFDIAVPRDIDPAAGQLEGVYLYDIDDLEQVVAANIEERAREARRAERLLEEELARFRAWLAVQDVVPTIRLLREKAEDIRQAELQKALRKLPGLDPHQRRVVEAMSAAIVNKLLNDPTQRLKALAEAGEADGAARLVTLLFDLEGPDVGTRALPLPARAERAAPPVGQG